MNTPSIKKLQQKVNRIAAGLGGIDTVEKLRQAQRIAGQDSEIAETLQEIIKDALRIRWRKDSTVSIEKFLRI